MTLAPPRTPFEVWQQARLGAVTASRFKDVMTEPRTKALREAGELSETAKRYAEQLVAERLTGAPCESFGGNDATKWGNEWEPTALAQAYDVLADRIGELNLPRGERVYVPHPEENWIGCSPDALSDSIGIEIKCPYNPANHVRTLIHGMPEQHTEQIQGTLWITGGDVYMFVSYDPRIVQQPLYLQEIPRDEAYIQELAERVVRFRDYVEELYQQIAG